MIDNDLVVLDEVSGRLTADAIVSYLEAIGVPAMVSMEALGSVYSLSVGALGRVQILVSQADEALARELLSVYYSQTAPENSDEPGLEDEDTDEPDTGE